MRDRIAALSLFIGSFAIYLFQTAPAVTSGDSGEFITTAATLSLAHAPSFPLFSILGHAFIDLIPWAAVPFRVNLFSAFTSSLCLVLVFWMVRRWDVDTLNALLLSLVMGVTLSFMHNSLITEVFALNNLWVALLLWCLVRADSAGELRGRWHGLFFFLLGLGLGNHHILVLVGGAFLCFLFLRSDWSSQLKLVPAWFGLFLLGFSIYLTLPIRSAKEPPLNWGQPTTVEKFTRTILRKDYGTMKLALGDTPQRTGSAYVQHAKRFGRQLQREFPLPVGILAFIGLLIGIKRRDSLAVGATALFLLAGPAFLLLGNLPFTAQSEGIMGRFYIMPLMGLLLGFAVLAKSFKQATAAALLVLFVFTARHSIAETASHRHAFMVWDYGRAMLRTLPPQAALLLDGGDDAFYSLAMYRYALGFRPDTIIHDRGGLVFKNLYGDDFRSIPKEEKTARRHQIERLILQRRPLFYGTMDQKVLPGATLQQTGFLMEADPKADQKRISWPLITLRSLYPLTVHDYRTRALAAFFPFMEGQQKADKGQLQEALKLLRKASYLGREVEWAVSNIGYEYAMLGFAELNAGRYSNAETIYLDWIRYDPGNWQAYNNYGVVLERAGRVQQAKDHYKRTALLFPNIADPVYNLAVLAWHESSWAEAVAYFEEALRRNPNHGQARGFLIQAKMKMAGAKS